MAVKIGEYNDLTVLREVSFGLYLDDEKEGILLPKRFVPEGVVPGDSLRVFVYHDGEDRLIATTQEPHGKVGDIVKLRVVNTTPQGAFLDNGLMKDLFVPTSKQLGRMKTGADYLVYVYLDLETRRLTATEKFEYLLSNENLTVKEKDEVDLIVYRRSDIGYVVIINSLHTGVLHFSDIFRSIQVGDKFKGYIRKITDDLKIDVAVGKAGYSRVEGEGEKILRLLGESGGHLPYHDKSSPDDIYEVFQMSKKAFKMAVGQLYKQRSITIDPDGIRLIKA